MPPSLPWALLLSLSLGMGCVPQTSGTPGGDGQDDSAPPDTGTPPLWDVSAVEAGIAALMSAETLPNARDMTDLFRALTLEGDASCPGSDLAFTTPSGSCISESGWEYYGYAPWVDVVEGEAGARTHRVDLGQASFVITAPDGRTFSAGGGFLHEQAIEGEGALAWEQSFSGTWRWTGEGAAWLTTGVELGWTLSGSRAGDHRMFTLTGPFSVGDAWLYIDALRWDTAVCDGVPEVALQIRDEVGNWYQWSSGGADCSPCGPVVVGGETVVGEACVDLSAAMVALDAGNDLPEEAR